MENTINALNVFLIGFVLNGLYRIAQNISTISFYKLHNCWALLVVVNFFKVAAIHKLNVLQHSSGLFTVCILLNYLFSVFQFYFLFPPDFKPLKKGASRFDFLQYSLQKKTAFYIVQLLSVTAFLWLTYLLKTHWHSFLPQILAASMLYILLFLSIQNASKKLNWSVWLAVLLYHAFGLLY